MKNRTLTIGKASITERSDGLISLTDIWKAANDAGIVTGKLEPKRWAQRPVNKTSGSTGRISSSGGPGYDFINKFAEIQKVNASHLLKSVPGKNGGTFAHWQIALAYAKYLSPALHMQVNEVFKRFTDCDPSLVQHMAERATDEQRQEMAVRIASVDTRKQFTRTLSHHGVHGYGFGSCTNAIYKPLLGGKAEDIRKGRNLPAKANLREHMTSEELIRTSMAELVAKRNIEATRTYGNEGCADMCERAAAKVAAL